VWSHAAVRQGHVVVECRTNGPYGWNPAWSVVVVFLHWLVHFVFIGNRADFAISSKRAKKSNCKIRENVMVFNGLLLSPVSTGTLLFCSSKKGKAQPQRQPMHMAFINSKCHTKKIRLKKS
jgi:hypothetical protein